MRMERESLIAANINLRNQLEVAKIALDFYAKQKNFVITNGLVRIIDNGGIAEEALLQIDRGVIDINSINESVEILK